jgi:hypothetical protein
MALKNIFVKSEAVYEPVGSNLQALFYCAEEGHLPCLRLIRKIVYGMDKEES